MNAPATAMSIAVSTAATKIADRATAHAAATYAIVPLADIEPSTSDIQRLRRARFTAESLEQLAASIRQVGVAEPVLLRPMGKAGFELVAGERRWMAARMAGLAEIPAMVRAYTNEQALELQLIENLQRVDLHEMEEAEGYDALRKLKKLSVEQIAEQLGKSRSQVFARLKLLELCPEARKAFYAGEFEASVALLIARLPRPETQRELLKELSGKGKLYWDQDGPLTFRQVQEHVQEAYMADLKGAGFALNDATLRDGCTTFLACTACPNRTGNQKDLFTEIKNPNVCTDPPCLKRKEEAARARKRAELEAKGETIISGAPAKKIKPNQYSCTLNEGYVDLAEDAYIGGKYQSYRKAIGKQPCATALLECPHTGKLFEIAKRVDVTAALKANGVKPDARTSFSSNNKEQERKNRLETAINTQILAEIRGMSRARQFNRDDTVLVATAFFSRLGFDDRKRLVDAWNAADGIEKPKGHDYVHDFEKKIPALTDADLGALFIDMALIGACYAASYCGGDTNDLLATAKRLGVDAAGIRAELTAAAKEKLAAKKKTAKK
jgi:ParB/RepB/Spo0J family partition protein